MLTLWRGSQRIHDDFQLHKRLVGKEGPLIRARSVGLICVFQKTELKTWESGPTKKGTL